jgi:hypothetical protein
VHALGALNESRNSLVYFRYLLRQLRKVMAGATKIPDDLIIWVD